MKTANLAKSYAGKNMAIIFLTASNIILVLCLITVVVIQAQQKAIVTMKFPGQSEEAVIEHNKANINYKMGVGKYMAHSLGNITPRNAKFTKLTIEQMLAPSVYQEAIKVFTTQLEKIKKDKLSLSFDMRKVTYEPSTEKVFVYGFSVIQLPTGNRKQSERTYEFIVTIDNYMPSITHLDTYSSVPRTKEQILKDERNNPQGRTNDQ